MTKNERVAILLQCGRLEDAIDALEQAHELSTEPQVKEILFGVTASLERILACLVKGE